MMMAISAVDNALWDLKGQYYKKPVYRLLGGNRTSYKVYGSMLGNSTIPERAAKLAVTVKNMGHPAQKWFLPWGPRSAEEGMRDNAALAAALREAVGPDYPLMFDAWMGWNISYAQKMMKMLEPYNPTWVEEPLPPQMLDGYRELRKRVNVPIAAGEHLYTTWEVRPYLEAGVLAVVQADPDWCGGISELVRIGTLCREWNIPLIPHGMGVHAAGHTIAGLPESTCPCGEYLFTYMENQTSLFKYPLKPENGFITLRDDVYGLGMDLDEEKIETKTQIIF
jgi:L-alanine-DL-glutamate epimerase-like enolase superfamily enzyme